MSNRFNVATLLLLALVIVTGSASRSEAALVTLTDQNTLIEIDTSSQSGMRTWQVDGTDNLFQRWFWYRIGTSGPESSIDTISSAVTSGFGGGTTGSITYENSALRIQLSYNLAGGAPGSLDSDLAEQITITNKTRFAMDFHFFEYTDFDLNGTPGDDTIQMVGATEVLQNDGASIIFAAQSLTPAQSHHEVNIFSATRDSLNDGAPTTLNDFNGPAGPGDVTWAFQWDVNIGRTGSFTINGSLEDAVDLPEPASMLLFGIGMAGTAMGYRVRKRRGIRRNS